MNEPLDKRINIVLIVIAAIVFIPVVWFSDGAYQSGDTFQHYLISRYAFHHPELFLDHWGKPLFTLLYAAPSQLGYTGAKIFTVILGLSAAWVTYRIARNLHFVKPGISMVLVLFAPMFFAHLNSCMTEVLFSFWITWSIWFWLNGKWIVGAIWLSFLPFIRTEGFILIPFMAFWPLINRKWLVILLLSTGTMVYSILGGLFHHHDFLWIIHKNPYALNNVLYGSGEWLHFIKANKVIWGIPFSLCLLMGLGYLMYKAVSDLKKIKSILLLVVMPFLVFLCFHSFAWATGKFASNGELRVLAAVMPLAAIIAHYGLHNILRKVNSPVMLNAVVVLMMAVVVITPFQLYHIPFKRTEPQRLMHEAIEFVKPHLNGQKIHYFDAQVPLELNLDPFDLNICTGCCTNPQRPDEGMATNDFVIWDGHFGPMEGNCPADNFDQNVHFKLIKEFVPEKEIKMFDRVNYSVKIYQCKK
jgi:hypothetical protein